MLNLMSGTSYVTLTKVHNFSESSKGNIICSSSMKMGSIPLSCRFRGSSFIDWMIIPVFCWLLARSYMHMYRCHSELKSNDKKTPLQMFLKEKGRFSLSRVVYNQFYLKAEE